MTNQQHAIDHVHFLTSQGVIRLEAINRASERYGISRLDLARLTAGDTKKTRATVASTPQGLMGTA